MMIEDILDAQKFEGHGNQKNIVGRITALNHIDTVPEIDPRRIQKFPEQSAAILPQISEQSVTVFGQRVTVDPNPVDHLVPLPVPLAFGT